MLLADYQERLSLERGHGKNTVVQLQIVVRGYSRWLGRSATLEDLCPEQVNRWIQYLEKSGISLITVANKKRELLTLWNGAWHERLIDHGPLRIRRVRQPRWTPQAWTKEEVEALLDACRQFNETLPKLNVRAGDWLNAFVSFEWDAALRLGDVLSMAPTDIWPGNFICLVQQKTNETHRCQLSDETMEGLERIGYKSRYLLFPLWCNRAAFFKLFKQLRIAAGLSRGSSKWLRRSSATYVELRSPGSAQRHLGHRTPGLAHRHYLDPAILQERIVMPPPLLRAE